MPTIIDEDVIRQKAVSDEYRDGWERTFGDKDAESESKDCDAIECKITTWANVQPAPYEVSFPVPLEVDVAMLEAHAAQSGVCPHCGRTLDEHGICPEL